MPRNTSQQRSAEPVWQSDNLSDFSESEQSSSNRSGYARAQSHAHSADVAMRISCSPGHSPRSGRTNRGDYRIDSCSSREEQLTSDEDLHTDEIENDQGIVSNDPPWQLPPWGNNGPQVFKTGGWYKHQPYMQTQKGREMIGPDSDHDSKRGSPLRSDQHNSLTDAIFDDEDITLAAARIPLPLGSLSPMRDVCPPRKSPLPIKLERGPPVANTVEETLQRDNVLSEEKSGVVLKEKESNYFRFNINAEVMQRTEAIETGISWIQQAFNYPSKSWTSTLKSITALLTLTFFYKILFTIPTLPPTPDIIKIASLARDFEPVAVLSEKGLRHVVELQETGVAVWDLSESVRSTNMTSAPIIIETLNRLYDSLTQMSRELSHFFTSIDGDIDEILDTLAWSKRELAHHQAIPLTTARIALVNFHGLLCSTGLLEHTSSAAAKPHSRADIIFATLFGPTLSQRTYAQLDRTFNEILSVLEDRINSELTYSISIFAHFDSIDRQFDTLQRFVSRESDTQQRLEGELLSSLWARLVGPHAPTMRKYEKNRALLASLRQRTLDDKNLLAVHLIRLHSFKLSLENLRRRLFSPLVARAEPGGRLLGVEEQLAGLEETYTFLKSVRDRQREKRARDEYGRLEQAVHVAIEA